MTTNDIVAQVSQASNNIEAIKERFFEVIKVPMVTFADTVAEAVATNEAQVFTAEVIKENEAEIVAYNKNPENAEPIVLDKDSVFKLAYKKAYKSAMKKYTEIVDFEEVPSTELAVVEPKKPTLTKFTNPSDIYGVFNAKTGKFLSSKSMGKDFLPMQQQEFLDNILATIHERGADLDINTLQFKIYCGGSKIEFSVKMFPLSFKNNKGIDDITNMELIFSTSYDGSKSNRISLYTERLVCLNGATALKLEGELKGRNTQGGKTKILSYAKEVADIVNGATEFKEKLIALDKIKLSKKQIEAFKQSLFGFNAESLKQEIKNAETLKQNAPNQSRKLAILNLIDKSIALEFNRTGETAFGLLQGVTHYTNHVANTSKSISNAEYIRFYQGAKTNDKAQEILFALID
jgi:hypothetical protein